MLSRLHKRPEREPGSLYETDEFRMYSYKVNPCPKFGSHDWTTCPFAHIGETARRRHPLQFKYAAIKCENFKREGRCQKGDACEFTHGIFEFWLHPARYRTRKCRSGRSCRRNVCFFAHCADELRVEIRYQWYYVNDPVQPHLEIGYEENGEVIFPLRPRPAPVTHGRPEPDYGNSADVGGYSEVVSSLEMLNIRNGQYEMPKATGSVSDPDLPDVNWVSELVYKME